MEATGPRPSRRPELVLGILAVLLAVAGAVIPFTGMGATGRGPTNAHAAMSRALTSTMDESTMHATFTATVTAAGKTVQLTGTARSDRASKSGAANVNVQATGHHMAVSVVITGGQIYLQLPQISQVEPGKSWLSFPEPATGASGVGTAGGTGSGLSPGTLGQMANLGTFLQLLRQSGATVQTLGASTLSGTPVDGYRVKMDGAAVEAAIAKSGLPQAAQQALSAITVSSLDFTVYTGGGLLRGVDVDAEANVASIGITVKATLRLDDYGQPVTVQPPPATATVTFGQVEKSANSSPTGPLALTGLRGMTGLGGLTALLPAA